MKQQTNPSMFDHFERLVDTTHTNKKHLTS